MHSGDGKLLLRSAKLYNFTHCRVSPDQLEEAAERFSHFTDNEVKCREMLVKYWVKDLAEVAQVTISNLVVRLHRLNIIYIPEGTKDIYPGRDAFVGQLHLFK